MAKRSISINVQEWTLNGMTTTGCRYQKPTLTKKLTLTKKPTLTRLQASRASLIRTRARASPMKRRAQARPIPTQAPASPMKRRAQARPIPIPIPTQAPKRPIPTPIPTQAPVAPIHRPRLPPHSAMHSIAEGLSALTSTIISTVTLMIGACLWLQTARTTPVLQRAAARGMHETRQSS